MPSRSVVYTEGQTAVPPTGFTGPEGYDQATVLAALAQPLPWEEGYVAQRWRGFTRLSGTFVFTFADPLVAPAALTRLVDQGHIYTSGRQSADQVTAPELAPTPRLLYGLPVTEVPRVRGRTLIYNAYALESPASTLTLTFANVPVAAVRASIIARLDE